MRFLLYEVEKIFADIICEIIIKFLIHSNDDYYMKPFDKYFYQIFFVTITFFY